MKLLVGEAIKEFEIFIQPRVRERKRERERERESLLFVRLFAVLKLLELHVRLTRLDEYYIFRFRVGQSYRLNFKTRKIKLYAFRRVTSLYTSVYVSYSRYSNESI